MDDDFNRRKGAQVPVCLPRSTACYAGDPIEVAADLYRALAECDPALVLYFGTCSDNPTALPAAIQARFGGVRCIGCTTAGEIAPEGYAEGTVTALAFPAAHFRPHVMRFDSLRQIVVADSMRRVRTFGNRADRPAGWTRLGILLVDGLSRQEEALVASIDAALPGTTVVGGSAGDGLDFATTLVFDGAEAFEDAALLCLLDTDFMVEEICIDNFVPTDRRVVVTRSDAAERLVFELNAEPAAEEYARLVGVEINDLTPFIFASNPLLVRAGGRYHVRSIQEVVDDHALRLFSAIDDGLVLTLGHAEDLAQRLERELDALPRRADMILGLDCFLRRLDADRRGMTDRVSNALSRHNVVGFSTYGEQHHGMHVNQTFVGVAFFAPG